jgi:HAD superfamily hydrolase (TIGR01549 family)
LYSDTKSALNKLKNYKKGIITNTPRDCTIQILKNFNFENYFDVIVTADEVSKGKPSPEIVMKACKYLNVKPKDVLLVGDTESDILAGRAAGCIIVGINIKADYTIKKLSDLTFIVENQE